MHNPDYPSESSQKTRTNLYPDQHSTSQSDAVYAHTCDGIELKHQHSKYAARSHSLNGLRNGSSHSSDNNSYHSYFLSSVG